MKRSHLNPILLTLLAFIGLCIASVAIMFLADVCPPSGPWPMPPWCVTEIASLVSPTDPAPTVTPQPTQATPTPEIVTLDLTVSVPYWTEGDVYLGIGENAALLKLEQVNEVTFMGTASVEKEAEYYFSRGTIGTRSVNTFKSTDLPRGLHAVVDWADSQKAISLPEFQKGLTFGGMLWRPEELAEEGIIEYNLDMAKSIGAEWITIIPDWFLYPDVHSSTIRPWFESDGPFPNTSGWVTPTLTDDQIIFIIQQAKARGLKIMLKPHVDPIDWSPDQPLGRGDTQPDDWETWYANYTTFILHYAELAEQNGVEIFVVGTEIDPAAMEGHPYGPAGGGQTAYFRNLIAEVRNVYGGKLTYSSSCVGECWGIRGIKFWGDLDYIGYEPYYSLTDKLDPTIEELRAGFLEGINSWGKDAYETYDKPLILTEIAYQSFDGSGKFVLNTPPSPQLDLQEQADAYEAVFQAIEDLDWVDGIYIWALYLSSPGDNMEWQLQDADGPFIGKPAGQVIKKWYLKIDD
jgi:hypothetical protein